MANNFEINLPPSAWLPAATNGPAQGSLATYDRPYLAFDDSTDESAITRPFQMPAAYTGSGTLKADIDYVMASATSGKVDFEISVEAITPADAVDLDAADSFDTANNNNETVPGTAGYLSKLTVTLSSKDSVQPGDYVRLKINRDANDGTNDTATGDARVLLVVLREEA